MDGFGRHLGFTPTAEDREALPDSVGEWPPFDDTVTGLHRLAESHRLVILSNIDDDLFARTSPRLGVEFADVVTAQQVGSYKPAERNFHFALERLGVPQDRVLHVAQSLYHDHVPAQRLGWSSVWVNRPSRRPGVGVAKPVEVVVDLEVPDLATLVRRVEADRDRLTGTTG